MANRNYSNGKNIFIPHVKPVLIDCNFIVAASDSGGLGITSLKGPMVQNVFMHTSATPGAGNSSPDSPNVVVTNPNPGSGTIIVQLQNGFNLHLATFRSIQSALSGSPLTSTTANVACVITALGTATAAQWRAVGLPAGITAAVGVAFVATASQSIGGSAAVQIAAATGSAVASIEVLGNPTLSINPAPSASQGFGGQIILQCRDYAGALIAPVDGSVISLSMYINDSSVQVSGE